MTRLGGNGTGDPPPASGADRGTGAPTQPPVQVEGYNHDRLLHELDEALEAWALADAERRKLDRMEKVVLAQCFNAVVAGSVEARKSEALTSKPYLAHLAKLDEYTTLSNVLRAKADGLTTRWETWRTLHSTYRKQIDLR